jgi:outer membrane protein OmpA-like peptidoglycan-associated protein
MQPYATLLLASSLLICGSLCAQETNEQVASVPPGRSAEASAAETIRFREMLAKYKPLQSDEHTLVKLNNKDRSALFEVFIDIPELNEVRATTVLFSELSHEVDASHQQWLDHFSKVLKDYPLAKVRIEAHTDSVGRASDNQTLSELRAIEVKDQLIRRGIGAERIHAVGLGERFPIGANSNREGRRMNRRVEFRTYFPVRRP